MRWFRTNARRHRRAVTPDTAPTRDVGGQTPDVAQRTSDVDGQTPDVAPDASQPRADWARLDPTPATVERVAPMTFDGLGFGRTVAGSRRLPDDRPRQRRSRSAPAGTMVDAAVVVGAPHRRPEGTDESAGSIEAIEPVTIRRPTAKRAVPSQPLTASDTEVSFPPLVHRHDAADDADEVEPLSWTVDDGFSTDRSVDSASGTEEEPSRMRLVGRVGSYDDAVLGGRPEGGTDDAVGTEADETAATEPTIRYLPTGGEPAPAAIASIVEAFTGVTVSDAVIDRSPSTSGRAADMGAIAFTDRGVAHVPAELGDLDDPGVRGVVAHELTHVAQHRAGRRIDDDTSDSGMTLEAEAHAVQRIADAGEPVTPAFARSRPSMPVVPTGVQRLRDDDQYAWQRRDAPTVGSTIGGFFGAAFGIPDFDTAGDEDDERRRQQRHAREFEREHAGELQQRRMTHYREIEEEAERELDTRVRRGERIKGNVNELAREEQIEVRRKLDEDMPWEFGVPPGFRAYPDRLRDPRDPDEAQRNRTDHDANDDDEHEDDETDAGTDDSQRGTATLTGPEIGQQRPARQRRERSRRNRRSGSGDDQYGWQQRPPTAEETATFIFGDTVGEIIGGLSSEEDERRQRQRREIAQSKQLHAHRRTREIQLRHVRLRQAAVEVRSEIADETDETARDRLLQSRFPVPLPTEEIVAVRTDLDDEMPLEFIETEYVGDDEYAAITPADRLTGRPADDEPSTEGGDEDEETRDVDGTTSTDPDAAGAEDADAAASAARTTSSEGAAERDGHGDTWSVSSASMADEGFGADGDHGDVDTADDVDMFDDDVISTPLSELLATASDIDLDDIAKRVYGRVRRELRHELLIDRERSGVLADVR